MVDETIERMNSAMKHALAKIQGGKIKAVADGDRVYLVIQDAPEELRRLADALEALDVNDVSALVAYTNPKRRQSARVKSEQVKTIDGKEREAEPDA